MNTLNVMDIFLKEIVKIYNIQDKPIGKFKIDSRKINPGDVFVAIKGNTKDGHDYVEDAIKLKASLIIISEDIEINCNTMIIKVRDTIKILGLLASNILRKIHVPVIAITGSNGKTTTKDLVSSLLSNKYKVLKNDGSLNNHLGLPLTILNYADEDVIVVEMGMNHFKEIDYLTKICHPNIGIITNIGTAHIGNLGSKKNILKAKLEILNGMKNGFLIVNSDDKLLTKVKCKENQIIRCGSHKNDDLQLLSMECYLDKTKCIIKNNNDMYDLIINVPGKYIVYDVLLAIEVAIIMKINKDDIVKTIANYKTNGNRANFITLDNFRVINDCYNASYESLDNILSILETTNNEKILILGDILEMGKHRSKILKKLIKKVNKMDKVEIFLMGKQMYKISKKIKNSFYFSSFEELYQRLDNMDLENKVILIKASHAMNFDKIYNYLDKVDK